MERRAAGIVALMLAVLAIAIMSAVVGPPLGGVATRSVVPAPPAVGACGNLRGPELVIVDCDDRHFVEVAYTWTPTAAAGERPTFQLCREKVRSYVGSPPAQDADAHAVGRWSFPLRYRQIVVTGPKGTTVRDWSWQACLVAPLGPAPSQGYQGRLQAVPSTGPVTSALRVCYSDPGTARVIVPCTSPHLGEVIATQPLSAAQDGSSMAVGATMTTCATAARSATGAADPTFGGQLRVTVLSDEATAAPFGADIGVYYTAEGSTWLVCSLESTGDRNLLGSLAGIGNGPLPFE